MSSHIDKKRIAKNTMFLYVRMFVLMAVNLFAFRILLKELGVDNYGIYNVIGGVVVLFAFINAALSQSTQRYLSYYIGKGLDKEITNLFSMSVNVHMFFGVAFLVIAETLGLWIVYNVLKFPPTSMTQVFWLYQVSVATFVVNLIRAPYNSAIVSYEKFSFFSYLSIAEAILKLVGVYCLGYLAPQFRLVSYGLLVFLIVIICWVSSIGFLKRSVTTIYFKRFWDKSMFKSLMAFNGWNMVGGISNIAANQGLNMVFNVFCGVVVNAAMGVSTQVYSAVNSFVTNFQTAFNPQITKSYAAGEKTEFFNFVFSTSRLSFCLMFVLGLPVIAGCSDILHLWLTDVPDFSVQFTQLMLVFCMIDALSGPLWVSAQAVGNIRNYMLLMSGLIMLNIPLAIILLYIDVSPVYVFVGRVVINLITHFVRIAYLRKLIEFPAEAYMKKVMLPALAACAICSPIVWAVADVVSGIPGMIASVSVALLLSAVTSFYIVLEKNERAFALSSLKKLRRKFSNA